MPSWDLPKKKENDYDRSAWADHSDRFSVDWLLRRARFRIYRRPAKGPVMWERGGKFFTQDHALSLIDPSKVADARAIEEVYRSGEL